MEPTRERYLDQCELRHDGPGVDGRVHNAAGGSFARQGRNAARYYEPAHRVCDWCRLVFVRRRGVGCNCGLGREAVTVGCEYPHSGARLNLRPRHRLWMLRRMEENRASWVALLDASDYGGAWLAFFFFRRVSLRCPCMFPIPEFCSARKSAT
jgi:hypothetical protein